MKLLIIFPFLSSDLLLSILNLNDIMPMFSFQHQVFRKQNELTKFFRARIFRISIIPLSWDWCSQCGPSLHICTVIIRLAFCCYVLQHGEFLPQTAI